MAIREGKWDCSYCGTTNLGRGMNCSACGRRRDPSVQFYLDDDAPEVQDQQSLARARSGADWTCSFCGTDNAATDEICRQCHASKGDSEARATRTIPLDTPTRGGPGGQSPGGDPKPPEPNPARRKPLPMILAAIAVVAVLSIAGILIIGGKEETLAVDELRWERSIDVETQQLNRYERPENEVPAGARILSSRTVQDGTERVQVGSERVKTGTRDLGNGFFEDVYEDRPVYEERPVYVTMVEYEILEWETVRTARAEGDAGRQPFWPEVDLGSGEREGQRREKATLFLSSDEERYEYEIPVEDIGAYPVGSRWLGRIGPLGGVRSLERP
jgi:hypothetical protein